MIEARQRSFVLAVGALQESCCLQIQGDQFALQDEFGETYVFTRVR